MESKVWAIFMTISFSSFAKAAPPAWAAKTMHEDTRAFYCVGRGSAQALQEAQDNARRDAVETCIKEIFGYKTKIKTVSYENTQSSEVVKGTAEASRSIELKDFNEIDFYNENEGPNTNVFVRFKYSKDAVENEWKRQSEKTEKEESLDFISVESLKKQIEFQTEDKNLKIKDLQYSNYFSQINSWSFSFEGGFHSSTYKNGSDYNSGSLGLQKRFSTVGLLGFYEGFFPRSSNDNNPDKPGSSGAGMAVSYYYTNDVLENYYVSIEGGQISTELKSVDVKQQYYGLNVGWDMYFFDFKIGARKYSDFENYQGQVSAYFSGGLKINF